MKCVAALLVTTVMLASALPSNAARTEPFTGRWKVLVARSGATLVSVAGPRLVGGEELYSVTVRDGPTPCRHFGVASHVAQLESLAITRGARLVLTGFASGLLDGVTVVDGKNGTILADFFCYWSAVSPDGRFVAYVQYFNPHGPDPILSTNIYKVVDVENQRRKDGFLVDPGFEIFPFQPLPRWLPKEYRLTHRLVHGDIRWVSNDTLTFLDVYLSTARQVTIRVTGPGRAEWLSLRPLPGDGDKLFK